jgi:hypothetical protein
MPDFIDMNEIMTSDVAGNIFIENHKFENLIFNDLYFIPDHQDKHENHVYVNNCIFDSIKIKGSFDVYDGVSFRDTVFKDVVTRDYFLISSYTVMDHVVMSCKKKTKGLWIKPLQVHTYTEIIMSKYRTWFQEQTTKIDIMLDLRDYHQYVEIEDFPCDKVLINPALQVKVDRRYLNINWESYGIPWTGTFWGFADRLNDFKCDQAIFSLPLKQEERADPMYHKELEILYKHGLLTSIDELR